MNIGELYALLTLHAEKFESGLSSAERQAQGSGSKIGGALKAVGTIAIAAFAAAAGAVIAFGVESARVAETEKLALNRLKAVFGSTSTAVISWSETSAKAWGVNDTVLQNSVSKYALWGKNVGMSLKEATTEGENMSKRAHEISLSTGASYDDVFNTLLKGAQGATKGLKTYGVAISTQAITDEAYRLGLEKTGVKLTDLDKAQARSALILQQTTSYTKTAAEAQGNMADSSNKMGEIINHVMEGVGKVTLNIAEAVFPKLVAGFQVVSDWVDSNMPAIQKVIETVSGAIGDAFNTVASVAVPFLTAAFDVITNDILPAVSKAFDWLSQNVIPPLVSIFRDELSVYIGVVSKAFAFLQGWIKDNWPLISKIVGEVGAAVKTAFDVMAKVADFLAPILLKLADVLFPALGVAGTVLLKAIQLAFDAIGVAGDLLGKAFNVMQPIVLKVFDALSGGVRIMASVINGVLDGIRTAIKVVSDAIQWVVNAWQGSAAARAGLAGNAANIPIPGTTLPTPTTKGYGFASGVTNFLGGMAMVGEKGPELAYLAKGTNVIPADLTAAILGGSGGGGVTVNVPIQNFYGSEDNISKLSRALGQQVRLATTK
jgi:hypothetical protein